MIKAKKRYQFFSKSIKTKKPAIVSIDVAEVEGKDTADRQHLVAFSIYNSEINAT